MCGERAAGPPLGAGGGQNAGRLCGRRRVHSPRDLTVVTTIPVFSRRQRRRHRSQDALLEAEGETGGRHAGGGHAGGEHVTRAAPTWPTLQTARRTSVVGGIRRRRLGGRRGWSWAPETPHRRPARLCPLPGAIPAACGVFRGSEEVVGVCECGVHADPGRYWRALGGQGRRVALGKQPAPRACAPPWGRGLGRSRGLSCLGFPFGTWGWRGG